MIEKEIFKAKALFAFPQEKTLRALFLASILKEDKEVSLLKALYDYQKLETLPHGGLEILSSLTLHLILKAKEDLKLSENDEAELKRIYLYPLIVK